MGTHSPNSNKPATDSTATRHGPDPGLFLGDPRQEGGVDGRLFQLLTSKTENMSADECLELYTIAQPILNAALQKALDNK